MRYRRLGVLRPFYLISDYQISSSSWKKVNTLCKKRKSTRCTKLETALIYQNLMGQNIDRDKLNFGPCLESENTPTHFNLKWQDSLERRTPFWAKFWVWTKLKNPWKYAIHCPLELLRTSIFVSHLKMHLLTRRGRLDPARKKSKVMTWILD